MQGSTRLSPSRCTSTRRDRSSWRSSTALSGVSRRTTPTEAACSATLTGGNVRPDRPRPEPWPRLNTSGVRTYGDHLASRRHREGDEISISPRVGGKWRPARPKSPRSSTPAPRIGAIARCLVRSGRSPVVPRFASCDGSVTWQGNDHVAQAVQEDARGREGFECGIGLPRLPGREARRPHRDLRRNAKSRRSDPRNNFGPNPPVDRVHT